MNDETTETTEGEVIPIAAEPRVGTLVGSKRPATMRDYLEQAKDETAKRVVELRRERDEHDENATKARDELNARLVEERRLLNEEIAAAVDEAKRIESAWRSYTRGLKES